MDFDLWLAFIAAYAVISLIPGPSVFMVTGQALGHGLRAAMFCILGDVLGGVILIALSLFGVGAILATSAALFLLVKWAGVVYLAYLGALQIWAARKLAVPDMPGGGAPTPLQSLKTGFLVGVLNPKAILFYMAFLPQFMDPTGNAAVQFAILVPSATVVVALVLGGYALVAGRARQVFQGRAARRRFGYAGGGFLIGGSVFMALRR